MTLIFYLLQESKNDSSTSYSTLLGLKLGHYF